MRLIKLFEQYIREEAEIAAGTKPTAGPVIPVASGPVTPGLNYADLANALDTAMRGPGTDEDSLTKTLNQIKTPQDWKNVYNAFGKRTAIGSSEAQTLDQWFINDITDLTEYRNIIQAFYDRLNKIGVAGQAAVVPGQAAVAGKAAVAAGTSGSAAGKAAGAGKAAVAAGQAAGTSGSAAPAAPGNYVGAFEYKSKV